MQQGDRGELGVFAALSAVEEVAREVVGPTVEWPVRLGVLVIAIGEVEQSAMLPPEADVQAELLGVADHLLAPCIGHREEPVNLDAETSRARPLEVELAVGNA